jgi:hypothetical protein
LAKEKKTSSCVDDEANASQRPWLRFMSKPRAAKARGKGRYELADDEASCDEDDDSGFNDGSGFSSDSN